MKKTLTVLLVSAGMASAAQINLLSTDDFVLCSDSDDVLDAEGISVAELYGYDCNKWYCTYQQTNLNDQSIVTADGLTLQLGNAAALNKGNYAAVRLEADSLLSLSFDVSCSNVWGGDNSAFTADYHCCVYGYDSEGSATLLGSWEKTIKRNTMTKNNDIVEGYDAHAVTITLDDASNADYASYGIIFDATKTVAGAGGMAMEFDNIIVTSVPEPATASLSLLGLAALMLRRRRA